MLSVDNGFFLYVTTNYFSLYTLDIHNEVKGNSSGSTSYCYLYVLVIILITYNRQLVFIQSQ